jgi:hypothetical protein
MKNTESSAQDHFFSHFKFAVAGIILGNAFGAMIPKVGAKPLPPALIINDNPEDALHKNIDFFCRHKNGGDIEVFEFLNSRVSKEKDRYVVTLTECWPSEDPASTAPVCKVNVAAECDMIAYGPKGIER